MSYQAVKIHGGNLHTYYQGKEASRKRLPMVRFLCHSRKGVTVKTAKKSVVARSWGEGVMKLPCRMHELLDNYKIVQTHGIFSTKREP